MGDFIKKYNCIKQLDPSDCAAACIATICKHYGYDVSISKIREMAGTSNTGTSMYGIDIALKRLGFNSIGLKIKNIDFLYESCAYPFIAHIVTESGNTHFVVIHKICGQKIVIADPADGLIEVSIEEFERSWSKKIIVMNPVVKNRNKSKENGTKRQFVKIILKEKRKIFKILIISVFVAVLGVISACYFREIIDKAYALSSRRLLYSITFFILCCVISKSVLEFIRGKLQIGLSEKISKSVMLEFYNKVLELPIEFFDKREAGEIISRFSDAYKIREVIGGVILSTVLDGIMCITSAILIFKINVKLFFVTCVPILLYLGAGIFFRDKIDKANYQSRKYDTQLTEFLIDSIKGINTIKAFNAQKNIFDNTKKKVYNLLEMLSGKERIINSYGFVKGVIGGTFVIGIIFFGTIKLIDGYITLGDLVTFNALLAYFIEPVQRIMGVQPAVQEALVATERIYGMIFLDSESNGVTSNYKDFKFDSISFSNVSFTYIESNKKVLDNITFKVEKGEHIGIIGLSGAGKTTVVKLLLNYYNCEEGDIHIGNKNIKELPKEILRKHISYIAQESDFFQGTIYDNITLFDKSITIDEVKAACQKSFILDFIENLPNKWDTLVESEGRNMSGGQRQRIALARAFIKKSEIIILDEVTSNMDIKLEKEFVNLIKGLKNITVLIISHKPDTIRECDRIFTLKEGRIIENKGIDKSSFNNM